MSSMQQTIILTNYEVTQLCICVPLGRNELAWLLAIVDADSRLVPSQGKTSLQSNAFSRWLGANQESALIVFELVQPWTLRGFLSNRAHVSESD